VSISFLLVDPLSLRFGVIALHGALRCSFVLFHVDLDRINLLGIWSFGSSSFCVSIPICYRNSPPARSACGPFCFMLLKIPIHRSDERLLLGELSRAPFPLEFDLVEVAKGDARSLCGSCHEWISVDEFPASHCLPSR
jgi:hypothetical protein